MAPTPGYKLTVKMVGIDRDKPSMAIGVLSLIAPDGTEKDYTFRSGGFGKGMLPGLDGQDLNSGNENISAVYHIGDGVVQEGGADVKGGQIGYQYAAGKGFFLHIENDKIASKTGRDGFLIHPDGGRPGTQGCIGITADQAEDFQNTWAAIPAYLRPKDLFVMKPEANLAVVVNEIATSGASQNQEKYMLLLTGSHGEATADLQKFLKGAGFFEGEPIGKFGKETKDAVIAFQTAHHLKIDGIVGPETFGEMEYLMGKSQHQEVIAEGTRINIDKDLLKKFAKAMEDDHGGKLDLSVFNPNKKTTKQLV